MPAVVTNLNRTVRNNGDGLQRLFYAEKLTLSSAQWALTTTNGLSGP